MEQTEVIRLSGANSDDPRAHALLDRPDVTNTISCRPPLFAKRDDPALDVPCVFPVQTAFQKPVDRARHIPIQPLCCGLPVIVCEAIRVRVFHEPAQAFSADIAHARAALSMALTPR